MNEPRRGLAQGKHLLAELEYTRKICLSAWELLGEPVPDTFLGRKTQEAFPFEETNPCDGASPKGGLVTPA